jgi:hypothetical protein
MLHTNEQALKSPHNETDVMIQEKMIVLSPRTEEDTINVDN